MRVSEGHLPRFIPGVIKTRCGAYLPHWTCDGGTYAVTFRLADSLPQSVLAAWVREREAIVVQAQQAGRAFTDGECEQLRFLHGERVEGYLDAGHGACHLRVQAMAQCVATALRHFHPARYHLHAWCVMPNHVHAVVTPAKTTTLDQILHNWKSYTAHRAADLVGTGGVFWQAESYDHLVRDEADFRHAVHYVLENPVRAGLRDWPWVGADVGSGDSAE